MAWVQRKKTVTNPDTGKVTTQYYWVWVADSGSNAASNSGPQKQAAQKAAQKAAEAARKRAADAARRRAVALARRRAAEAQRRAMELAAKQRAASAAKTAEKAALEKAASQKRAADLRHQAYETLQARTRALIRDRIKRTQPNTQPVPRKPNTGATGMYERNQDAQERNMLTYGQRQQARRNAEKQAQAAAENAKRQQEQWSAKYYQWRREKAVKAGTKADSKELEALMAEEAAKAKLGQSSPEAVAKLQDAYEKKATKVFEDYNKVVLDFHAALGEKLVNGKWVQKGKPDYNKAKRVYRKWEKQAKEYAALFGDDKGEGSYRDFYKNFDKVSDGQREYYKYTLSAFWRDELAKQSQKAAKYGESTPGLETARETMGMLTGNVKTRQVQTGVDAQGKAIYEYLSPEEELMRREAERRVQMERLRAQYAKAQQQRKALMMAEGLTNYNGQTVDSQDAAIAKQADELARELYGEDVSKVQMKRGQDVYDFVDKMVEKWEKNNPPPPQYVRTPGSVSGGGLESPEYLRWAKLRDSYEQKAFGFFGSNVPGLLDRTLTMGGVSHGMALLQGGYSAISAFAQQGNAALFGTYNIGGIEPQPEDAPDNIQAQAKAFAKKKVAEGGDPLLLNEYRLQYIDNWFKTAAGSKWYNDEIAKRKQADFERGKKFQEGFYGNGDAGTKLDALNEFGASPTQYEGLNLLASLALDPTNAVPLKFTTWAARGAFALGETAGEANKLKRAWQIGSKFIGVDEGTLGMRKFFDSYADEVTKKGLSREQAIDLLRERILGVSDESKRVEEARKVLRRLGIDPAKVNEAQLGALVEAALNKEAAKRGIDLVRQADEIRAKQKAAEAALASEKKARARAFKTEQAKVTAGLRKRREAGEKARERLAIKRTAQEERLQRIAERRMKKADAGQTGTPQAGADAGASGTPPRSAEPTVSPRRTVVDEPMPQQPAHSADQPGPTDNPILKRVADRVTNRTRLRTRRNMGDYYEASDEYYVTDRFGNRVPVDYSSILNTPEYQKLAKLADEGDADARRMLALRTRHARNQWRMEQQDMLYNSANLQSKHVTFRSSAFDEAEAAGLSGNRGRAREQLNADRRTIRHLVRQVALKNYKYVAEHYRIVRDSATARTTIRRLDVEPDSMMEWMGELPPLPPGAIQIGADLAISEGKMSLRGTHDLYEAFSHESLLFYGDHPLYKQLQQPGYVVKKLKKEAFLDRVIKFSNDKGLEKIGAEKGIALFRDAGMYTFEVFHQLRLAKEWEKLREFSDAMTIVLDEDPTNLIAWQWKVMEDRVGLPYSFAPTKIRDGFYDAAEDWGLHAELAMSMIPWGYLPQRAPLSYGLVPKLAVAAETASWFLPAKIGYTVAQAKDAVSHIFVAGSTAKGRATHVVHLMAEKYGDIIKAGPIRVRVADELSHQAAYAMGPEALTALLTSQKYRKFIDPGLIQKFQRRLANPEPGMTMTTVDDFIEDMIKSNTAKWSRFNTSNPRPEYAPIRNAVEEAYWAGDIPGLTMTPEAHELIFLAAIQTDPEAWVLKSIQFSKYMNEAGAPDRARLIIHDLFESEFATDFARASREQGDISVVETVEDTKRIALWKEVGLWRSPEQIRAMNQSIHARTTELEADLVKQGEREEWLREGTRMEDSASSGTFDLTDNIRNITDTIDDFRKAASPSSRASYLREAQGRMKGVISRTIDRGGAGMTTESLDALKEAAETLKAYPEMRLIFDRLQKEFGDMVQSERMTLADEAFAYQQALLELRLLWMSTDSKAVIPIRSRFPTDAAYAAARKAFNEGSQPRAGFEREMARVKRQLALLDQHNAARKEMITVTTLDPDSLELGQAQRRMPRHIQKGRKYADIHGAYIEDTQQTRLAEEVAGKKPEEAPVPDPTLAPSAAQTERLSAAQQVFEHVFSMNEEEWYAFEKERARKALINPRTSKTRRAAARKRIKQIESAEFAMQVEKHRGSYVPPKERMGFQKRVLDRFGVEAEKFVAPKMMAPYVEKFSDIVVEQGRMAYRALRQASPIDVPGVIKGIKHKGDMLDYLPREVYEELDRRIAKAIADARGYSADTYTSARRSGIELESDSPLGALRDTDPVVIEAKMRALVQFYKDTKIWVPLPAYDEARRVLRRPTLQGRLAARLLHLAEKRAAATGENVGDVFRELRDAYARREAKKQLGGLAFGEMYGHNPDSVFAEFVARYSDDGTIKHWSPGLTTFQRRTLEEYFQNVSGVKLADVPAVNSFLQSGIMPPLKNRQMTRDFLSKIGAWAPRLREQFTLGQRSWSVADEARYWSDNYGMIPEWANANVLGGEKNVIFHDYYEYIKQMKEWGIFDRSQEMALRLDGKTMKEIEEAFLRGDPNLNIPGRRELEEQRRYVIDRYGKLVSEDGRTLSAMPWLMYPSELRTYMTKRTLKSMPEGLVQNADELAELEGFIAKAMDPIWEKYMAPAAADGPIHYTDLFRAASAIQSELLASPKWAMRWRDLTGSALNSWSSFNRWLVFSNLAFLVMNVADVPIKGAWYRFSRRALFNRTLADESGEMLARLEKQNPEMFGITDAPSMYARKQANPLSRVANPRGLRAVDRALDRALAIYDIPVWFNTTVAGAAEKKMKFHLAQGMYPEVYRQALKRFGDAEQADVVAKAFISKEITKMWPTAGNGPVEQLFNRLVPFASYTVRNKMLWISEALDHPAVLNYINRIGAYIEAANREQWEKDHPGSEMPDNLARMIELPWAKGYFIDLTQFSDATRGLKPIFTAGREKSVRDFLAEWVRLINPGAQAGLHMMFNQMGWFPQYRWKPILSEDGYPTGKYERVQVPWTEPWSNDKADWGSVFWFVDVLQTAQKDGINLNSPAFWSLLGQTMMFSAIKTYDKMAVMNSYYMGLTKEQQKAFLATAQGELLREWWIDKADNPREVMDRIRDFDRWAKDEYSWWHRQPKAFRDRVTEARDKIKRLRAAYAGELAGLEYGTAAYKAKRAEMYLKISGIYDQYPELLQSEVYGATPAQWQETMAQWQVEEGMDQFMVLNSKRPVRSNFKSQAAFNKSKEAWEEERRRFLIQHPQVALSLGSGISQIDSVKDKIDKMWDQTLDRIGDRKEMMEAAKAEIAKYGRDSARGEAAQERLDLMYLQNEMDYSILERDYTATYFGPDDFQKMPKGVQGPPALIKPNLLKQARTFLDFNNTIYEKHVKDGTLDEYIANAEFGRGMRDASLYAKGGDPFGEFDPAKWYEYMRKHPVLREQYFANNPGKERQWADTSKYIEGIRSLWNRAGGDPGRWVKLLKQNKWLYEQYMKRNPEKRAQWERMDSYIRHISVWGKLVGASRWDEANKVWDSLPQWVKDEYYSKHPERRQRAQKSAAYGGYMQKWVGLFDTKGTKEAMAYFDSLPQWAKDRYYKNHPDKKVKWETSAKMFAKLRNYFAAGSEGQADYLAQNPDLRKWLAANASSKEQRAMTIMAAYRTIPKEDAWIRKVFREKYPEVFSQEALGERKLQNVYSALLAHPEVSDEFEKWVKAIWATYAEMLKHAPRPASSYFERDYTAERNRQGRGLSAAEVSK